MAKKNLLDMLTGEVNKNNASTESPAPDIEQTISDLSKEAEEPQPKRKAGRPTKDNKEPSSNVTFNLPDELIQQMKLKAVMEHTTQREIVISALRLYLDI